MDTLSYKTISANAATVTKKWVIVDAENQTLGRLATKVASLLRGKHKTNFTPHVDCGDYVIVINSDKINLTGDKWTKKEYISHSGYPGGQKIKSAQVVHDKDGRRLVEKAVKGMLPKSKLGRALFTNLNVYTGTEHPHEAQKPELIKI